MTYIERAAKALQALRAGPLTVTQLAELADAEPKTVRAWLQAFQRQGLVRPAGRKREARTGCASLTWIFCE